MAQARTDRKTPPSQAARIRERNEEKILKAATEIFARKGLDGARIAEIAKRAKVPHPNVYYYFRTKQEIYRRLVVTLIADWDSALENISPEREPLEAIEAYVRAKFDHACKHSAETRLFANEVLTGARYLTPATRRHMREITTRYAKIIDGWVADGKIAHVDSRHFLVMIWATSEFYSFLAPVVCDALQKRSLKTEDFKSGADALVAVVRRTLNPGAEH